MRNGVAQFLEHAARTGARRLDGRPAGLRPHRRRRCRLRGGVSGEGDRPAGARAVDAGRRNGLGYQGPGVTRSRCAAALDAQGNLVALDYDARAADYNHLGYNEPDTVLIAQLMGMRRADAGCRQRGDAVGHVRHSEPAHGRRTSCSLPLVWETPLRTGNLRDPNGPQVDVRLRVVHRRAGGGGEGRSGRVPPEAAHREHDRRQRVQARALDRRRQGGGGGVRLGSASVAEAARQRATSSPAAASPTRSAARPSSPRSPRSR